MLVASLPLSLSLKKKKENQKQKTPKKHNQHFLPITVPIIPKSYLYLYL